MNPQYQQFFDANSNPSASDPYEVMGYKSPNNAKMRYDAVLDALRNLDTHEKVISDAGAGTGSMWTHWLETHPEVLKSLNLKKIYLVDSCQETISHLYSAKDRLVESGYDAEVVEEDFITGLPESDIVVSVGALNYYPVDQFYGILKAFDESSKEGFIFETNVQTPHSSTDVGTWNQSVESIYQYLYANFLSNGKSRVYFEGFKKWTTVWTVRK